MLQQKHPHNRTAILPHAGKTHAQWTYRCFTCFYCRPCRHYMLWLIALPDQTVVFDNHVQRIFCTGTEIFHLDVAGVARAPQWQK